MSCANSPTGYANPDAVTQIANGLSTTTYSYDNNGNLTQSTTDGTTTTYVYDYANRLTALGVKGAPTTYGHDAFGCRVHCDYNHPLSHEVVFGGELDGRRSEVRDHDRVYVP